MQDAPLEPEDAVEIDIDLATDLEDLETKLSAPVDSVRLWWKGTPVGRVQPTAGAERLSAIHVRDEVVRGSRKRSAGYGAACRRSGSWS